MLTVLKSTLKYCMVGMRETAETKGWSLHVEAPSFIMVPRPPPDVAQVAPNITGSSSKVTGPHHQGQSTEPSSPSTVRSGA